MGAEAAQGESTERPEEELSNSSLNRFGSNDAALPGLTTKQLCLPQSSEEYPRRVTIDLTQESLEAPGWFAPLIPVPAVVPVRTEQRPFSGLGRMAELCNGHMRPSRGIAENGAVFIERNAVLVEVIGQSHLVPGVGRDAFLAECPEQGIHLMYDGIGQGHE